MTRERSNFSSRAILCASSALSAADLLSPWVGPRASASPPPPPGTPPRVAPACVRTSPTCRRRFVRVGVSSRPSRIFRIALALVAPLPSGPLAFVVLRRRARLCLLLHPPSRILVHGRHDAAVAPLHEVFVRDLPRLSRPARRDPLRAIRRRVARRRLRRSSSRTRRRGDPRGRPRSCPASLTRRRGAPVRYESPSKSLHYIGQTARLFSIAPSSTRSSLATPTGPRRHDDGRRRPIRRQHHPQHLVRRLLHRHRVETSARHHPPSPPRVRRIHARSSPPSFPSS